MIASRCRADAGHAQAGELLMQLLADSVLSHTPASHFQLLTRWANFIAVLGRTVGHKGHEVRPSKADIHLAVVVRVHLQ
jgi:hypothetical protein